MKTTFSISRLMLSTAAALVIVGGVSVMAQEDGNNDRLDEAWKDAIEDQEPILTEQQFALLNNLAFSAAATKICDGFTLDMGKFSQGMADATKQTQPNLGDEDGEVLEAAVLIRFGTTYGLFLAEGNANVDSFCESAKEHKADSSTPNFWQ